MFYNCAEKNEYTNKKRFSLHTLNKQLHIVSCYSCGHLPKLKGKSVSDIFYIFERRIYH